MLTEPVKTNRQYKDRLFRLIFGSEEQKHNIMSLYNALNHSDYTNPDDFEITTLDDAIYIKMKNDVSFLIDSYLTLWEQQSSYNPNMPIRGLMFFGKLYSAYLDEHGLNQYGSTLVQIPTPQYIVFYNGSRDLEPIQKLRLSDAFLTPDKSGEFEWTATMYNLNRGKNEDLLSMCKPLSEYMYLINCIRDNQKRGLSVKEAIDKAVVQCISENVMAEYLRKHRAEVMDVSLTEFNEKVFVDGIRAEGRAEGLEIGLTKGIKALILDNLEDGKDQAVIVRKPMKRFALDEDAAKQYFAECSKDFS